MAKQIGAITFVLPSSHVAMLSHPKEVANVIEDAGGRQKVNWPKTDQARSTVFLGELG